MTNVPRRFYGALLLPPALAPSNTSAKNGGSDFYVLVDSSTLKRTMARISAHSPLAQFDLGPLGWDDPDSKQYPDQVEWLTVGAVLGLAIGTLALLAATIGETRDHSSRMRGLRILGAAPRQLASAHYWAVSAPILILGWIATLCGWLTATAIYTFDDRASVNFSAIAWTSLAVAVTALLIATVTLPESLHRSEGSAAIEA